MGLAIILYKIKIYIQLWIRFGFLSINSFYLYFFIFLFQWLFFYDYTLERLLIYHILLELTKNNFWRFKFKANTHRIHNWCSFHVFIFGLINWSFHLSCLDRNKLFYFIISFWGNDFTGWLILLWDYKSKCFECSFTFSCNSFLLKLIFGFIFNIHVSGLTQCYVTSITCTAYPAGCIDCISN